MKENEGKQKKKLNKKRIIVTVVTVAMLGLIGISAMSKPDPTQNIGGFKDGPRVEVERVTKGDIQAKISSSGTLEAEDTATIYVDTANKVKTIYKKEGDTVKKGEVILVMDQETRVRAEREMSSLQSQLAAAKVELDGLLGKGSEQDILDAKAQITSAESSIVSTQTEINQSKKQQAINQDKLTSLEKDLQLDKELLEQGVGTQKDIDDKEIEIKELKNTIAATNTSIAAKEKMIESYQSTITSLNHKVAVALNEVQDNAKKTSISAAQSKITELENQIKNKKLDIADASTEIKAPISGVITKAPKDEGQSVQAGEGIVTIVDPSKLKVTCDISPYYAADLKLGLDAEIKYTGSKIVEVAGKVTKVSSVAVTPETKAADGKTTSATAATIPVDVLVEKPGDIIKPGFSVDVKIITQARKNVCIVPILAVIEEDDESYVYVVNEETGSLEKRKITEGISSGLDMEVEGVKEGELIISSPSEDLTTDQRVSYEKLEDQLSTPQATPQETDKAKESGDK